MSLGPGGRYDKECQELAVRVQAEATLLIVLHGTRGSGFSMTMLSPSPLACMQTVANVLEETAKQIRADLAKYEAAT